MFDKIDRIKWSEIKSNYTFTEGSPEQIPDLLPNLLSTEKDIRIASLHQIFSIIVSNDQIAYFTEAAVPTMPFLMEYFAWENFSDYTEFLDELNIGMMLVNEFGLELLGVSPNIQQVYSSILKTICPYLDKLLPLLPHPNAKIRQDSVSILCCFPHEAPRLIPILLDSLEVVVKQYREAHISYLWHIQQLFIRSSPTIEQIEHFIRLHYEMFNLSLVKTENNQTYSKEMPLWIIRELVRTYRQHIPNEMLEYLKQL